MEIIVENAIINVHQVNCAMLVNVRQLVHKIVLKLVSIFMNVPTSKQAIDIVENVVMIARATQQAKLVSQENVNVLSAGSIVVASVETPKMTSITVEHVDINAHLVIVVSKVHVQQTVLQVHPMFVVEVVLISKQILITADHVDINAHLVTSAQILDVSQVVLPAHPTFVVVAVSTSKPILITVGHVDINAHLVTSAQILDVSQVVPPALPLSVMVDVSISKRISKIAVLVVIPAEVEKLVSPENADVR